MLCSEGKNNKQLLNASLEHLDLNLNAQHIQER